MTKLTIDFFIHDSEILSVIENTLDNTIDFILNVPIDWDKNVFAKKRLRFYNFLNYSINEIPLASKLQIIDFKDIGCINYSIGEGRNKVDIKRKKVELVTNAGIRTLEFEKLELIDEYE